MTAKKNHRFSSLGIPEIIAFCLAFIVVAAGSASAQAEPQGEISDIGTLETLAVAGPAEAEPLNLGAKRLLPLQFEGMPRASYFTVNPELKTLLISRGFIAEHNLWEYRFEREIRLPQANGGVVAGDLVRFYVLVVGSKALADVEAVICDECEETVGKNLLDQLHNPEANSN